MYDVEQKGHSYQQLRLTMDGRLADAYELLEGITSIRSMRLYIDVDAHEVLTHVIIININGCGRRFNDEYFNIDVWRRLGRAARDITLHELRLRKSINEDVDEINDELLLAAVVRCTDVFINEVKHNQSVVDMCLDLTWASMDDFS